jgi:hypothetical protein
MQYDFLDYLNREIYELKERNITYIQKQEI